jgi:hypothetical protein
MKIKFRLCFIFFGVINFVIATQAQTTTLTVSAAVSTSTAGSSVTQSNVTQIVIPTNVVAEVLHLHETFKNNSNIGGVNGGNLSIQIAGLSFNYTESGIASAQNTPIISGPAIISLNAVSSITVPAGSTIGAPWGSQDNMICTIKTNLQSQCITNQFTPNTGVVIPADSGGPVNIILESSEDLINWIPADPGTYGTSTTNRFFRVRATR